MNEKTLLTQEEVIKLGGALARLEELKQPGLTIVKPGDDTALSPEVEAAELVNYLSQAMLLHGGELLGAYFTLHNEYIPLLRGLAPVIRRVVGVQHREEPGA